MGGKMRWRWGDERAIMAAPAREARIDLGDLVVRDADGRVWPAVLFGDENESGGSLVDRQIELARRFVGVAMQESRRGREDPIRVATGGAFAFDFVSVPYEPDLLGIFNSHTLICVADKQQAIGRMGGDPVEPPGGDETITVILGAHANE